MLQSKFYFLRVIFPWPCAVYMYKIKILLSNFSSETTSPISTKCHVDLTVETELRVCSNAHSLLTVIPIYRKTIIINTFFFKTKNCSNDDPVSSCNVRIEKMLHNICMSVVAISPK